MKFILILLLYYVHKSYQILNERPSIKGCPHVTLMQSNISIDLMNGTWYEIFKDESPFRPGKCVSLEVTFVSNLNVSVVYSQIFNARNGKSDLIVSKFNATMINPYLWSASYDSLYISLEGYFYILDTDYYYYAVILACGKIRKVGFNAASEYGHMVWILSRTTSLNEKYLKQAHDTLNKNQMPLKTLRETNQNCKTTKDDIK